MAQLIRPHRPLPNTLGFNLRYDISSVYFMIADCLIERIR